MAKFRIGVHVRIKEGSDVRPVLKGKTGIIETCDPSPQVGFVYSVRLDTQAGRPAIANGLHEDNLEQA